MKELKATPHNTHIIIVRLDECYPLSPRNDAFYLCEKFFFMCPNTSELIGQCGHCQLFIHIFILPYFRAFCSAFLCGVALKAAVFNTKTAAFKYWHTCDLYYETLVTYTRKEIFAILDIENIKKQFVEAEQFLTRGI